VRCLYFFRGRCARNPKDRIKIWCSHDLMLKNEGVSEVKG
jgi:hypothetical protein